MAYTKIPPDSGGGSGDITDVTAGDGDISVANSSGPAPAVSLIAVGGTAKNTVRDGAASGATALQPAGNLTGTVKGSSYPASVGSGDVGKVLYCSAANTVALAVSANFIPMFCAANLTSSTAARYLPKRDTDGAASSADAAFSIAPVPFVATAMYVVLGTALPTANTTYTLMKGANLASLADTALTVTINAGVTSGSLTGQSVSFSAGDVYVMKAVNSAADAATLNVRVAIAIRPQ